MKHLEGAAAPFSHFSLCLPGQRDDALLAQALSAFKGGQLLDALLLVENVCRHHADKAPPAVLRAHIVEAIQPQLAARAWYLAWTCDPENPVLQDALLSCWLRMRAFEQVRSLGRLFLPLRCRKGNRESLLALLDALATAGVQKVGACWTGRQGLEGCIFYLGAAVSRSVSATQLHICDQELDFSLMLPVTHASSNVLSSSALQFSFALPRPATGRVFSVAFADGELLSGSPLIYAAQVPLNKLPRHAGEPAWVDIVVPVYRGLAQVKACLNSVLHSLPQNRTKARLIVVDDASPEPALSDWLRQLAAQNGCVYLRNRHNLGFVEAANRGMRHHAGHDVLLLNADTEVHGDWIDRLRRSLYARADIASATAWSNNGEISSFPKAGQAGSQPSSSQLAELDSIAAVLAQAHPDVDLPACCGFVMMIRRSALNQVGLLDGAGFYRGYGEEVDWCLRARAWGLRHVLAVGVYVAHAGGMSFGMEKVLRVRENKALLQARYPDYYPEYHRFIRDDGLAAVRKAFLMQVRQASALAPLVSATGASSGFLPARLPSRYRRIAVMHHDLTSSHAAPVLQLARLIAARPGLRLRLLVFGQISEGLWHTGVVDCMPRQTEARKLFADATLIGWAGCEAVLSDSENLTGLDLPYCRIDQDFDPHLWLNKFEENETDVVHKMDNPNYEMSILL